MHSGHFFHLDYISDEAGLQHIFRYRRVFKHEKETVANEEIGEMLAERSVQRYPIYVTLSPELVTFHFNGLIHAFYDSAIENIEDQFVLQHYECLVLPLTANHKLRDDLSGEIQDIIDKIISINPHVYQGRAARYDELLITYADLEVNTDFFEMPKPYESKSALFDTPSLTELKKQGRSRTGAAADREAPSDVIVTKRELLLDFLYDMRHSKVFENSPYFLIVEQRLRECELLNTLYAKVEYYYQRQNYLRLLRLADAATSHNPAEGENYRREAEEISNTLLDAEHNYLIHLTQPEKYSLFYDSGGWLYDVEKEMKALVFSDPLKYDPLDMLLAKSRRALSPRHRLRSFRFLYNVALNGIDYFASIFLPATWSSEAVDVEFHKNTWRRGITLLLGLSIVLAVIFFNLQSFIAWFLFIAGAVIIFWRSNYSDRTDYRHFQRESWIKWQADNILEEDPSSEPAQYPEYQPITNILFTREKPDFDDFRKDVSLANNSINNFFLDRFDILSAYRNAVAIHYRSLLFAVLALIIVISLLLLLAIFVFSFNPEISNIDPVETRRILIIILVYILCGVGLLLGIGMGLIHFAAKFFYEKFLSLFIALIILATPSLLAYCLMETPTISIVNIQHDPTEWTIDGGRNELLILIGLFFAIPVLYIMVKLDKSKKLLKGTAALLLVSVYLYLLLIPPIPGIVQPSKVPVLIISLLLLTVISYFLLRPKHVGYLRFNFNLVLPRMQLAIFSGMILFITTEELWKVNLRIQPAILFIAVCVIGFVSLYYLGNFIQSRTNGLPILTVTFRTITLLAYGLVIAVVFGTFSLSVIGRNMLINSGILEEWYVPPLYQQLTTMKQKWEEREELASRHAAQAREDWRWYTHHESDRPRYLMNHTVEHGLNSTTIEAAFDTLGFLTDSIRTIMTVGRFKKTRQVKRTETAAAHLLIPAHWLDNDTMIVDSIRALEQSKAVFDDYTANQTFSNLELSRKTDSLYRYYSYLSLAYQTLSQHVEQLLVFYESHADWLLFRRLEFQNEDQQFYLIEQDIPAQLGLADYIPDAIYYSEDRIRRRLVIYPRLLLLYAFLATFIGIFVQILSQDKSVTHPV